VRHAARRTCCNALTLAAAAPAWKRHNIAIQPTGRNRRLPCRNADGLVMLAPNDSHPDGDFPMTRVFNFSAGPAALPESVLRQAADEMLDWNGSGMSVMEMSHRGKEFIAIHAEAEALLRELLAIPANYKVLFMQGGAIGENAIVPMNMLRGKSSADYVDTGEWSKKSIKEAQKYAQVNVAASAKEQGYTSIPPRASWRLDPDAAYVHICSNETIGGVEYHFTPEVGDVPLVADMSSNILSRPVDVSKYGLIYGGAQKNIGPAGLTIVIVRDDLIGNALPVTPSAFDYKIVADNDSMYNTPPTYAIYIAGLVFRWIKARGGLAAMEAHNRAKAALLYDYLDRTSFYSSPVARDCRSLMNVPFKLKDDGLDAAFLKGAEQRGMVQLKGHRSVGGMRASIYNAMPIEGVQALVAYMKEFEAQHG
jgi:phosphoserine aminotransferase